MAGGKTFHVVVPVSGVVTLQVAANSPHMAELRVLRAVAEHPEEAELTIHLNESIGRQIIHKDLLCALLTIEEEVRQ